MKLTSLLCVLALLVIGCDRMSERVRHGDLVYSAGDVFGNRTLVLALARAAARGDLKEIDRQLSAGADVNAIGQHGITPLWWSAWVGNYKGFVGLLERGANPNAQRAERYPIMCWLAAMDDPRFLETALRHGGDPNLRDNQTGETPLFLAVMNGHKAQIDLLLSAKADVNAKLPISGMTLPMLAMATSADYELVYRLLQAGADPKIEAKGGGNLAEAIELRSVNASNNNDPWRKKVVDLLRSKGIDVKDTSQRKSKGSQSE